MAKALSFMLLLFVSLTTQAKNLGVYGEVFPVVEKDLRELLMGRLKEMETTGELAHYQEEMIHRVNEHLIRPKPLNLSTTVKSKSFHVDPTVTVNQDLIGPNGLLIAKAGARLNPFEHISFSKTLIFFNADDKWQVTWVKTHYKDYSYVKFILTGGDVRQASELFGRVYFDLNGHLTERLHLQHVPSVVYQEGLRWKVQEVGVNHA